MSRATADACETLRGELVEQWLGPDAGASWQPKCHLVLHSSDQGYLREVGQGGGSSVASSLVDRQDGRVTLRRIDVRATRSNWLAAALGHELTHLIVAERFVAHGVPRWVDEGLAILADPADKQRRHLQDFRAARARDNDFRLLELITLDEYPAQHRWGTFYGQSASLVRFLVAQSGEAQFLEFVEASLDQGYERGLRQVYGLGLAELERHWRADVLGTPPGKSNRQPAALVSVTRSGGMGR